MRTENLLSDEEDSLIMDLDEMPSPLNELSSLRPWNQTNLPLNSVSSPDHQEPFGKEGRRRLSSSAFQKPHWLSPKNDEELDRLAVKNRGPNVSEQENFGSTAAPSPRIHATRGEKGSIHSHLTTTTTMTTFMDFRTTEAIQTNIAIIPTALRDRFDDFETSRESSIFSSEDGFISATSSEDSMVPPPNDQVDHFGLHLQVDYDEEMSMSPTGPVAEEQRPHQNQPSMDYDPEPSSIGRARMAWHRPPHVVTQTNSADSYIDDPEMPESVSTTATSSDESGTNHTSIHSGSDGHVEDGASTDATRNQVDSSEIRIERTRQALREAERKRDAHPTSPSQHEGTFKGVTEKEGRLLLWPIYLGVGCLLIGVAVFTTVFFLSREDSSSSNGSRFTNDHCERALPLTNMIGSSVEGEYQLGSISESLSVDCGVESIEGHLRWYFIEGMDQRIRASTCNSGKNLLYSDTQLLVLTGSCGDLKCIAGSTELCGSHGSIGWFAEHGAGYYIVVSSPGASRDDIFTLSLDFPTENSSCDQSTMVDLLDFPIYGSTRGLPVNVAGNQTCDFTRESIPTAWYRLMGTGSVVCAQIATDSYLVPPIAMHLSVLQGADCHSLSCRDQGYPVLDQKSAVIMQTTQGDPYFIAVSGPQESWEGDFALNVFLTPPNGICEAAEQLSPGADSPSKGTLRSTCNIDIPECSGILDAGGIWYSIQGTGEMLAVEASGVTCRNESGPVSRISVFQSIGEKCSDLQCVDFQSEECDDDTLRVATRWFSEANATYMVLVQSTDVIDFELTASEVEPETPNYCQQASHLEIAGIITTGNTIEAETHDLGACSNPGSPGVWFQVEGTGNSLKASTCLWGTNYPTAITIMSGSCGDLECIPATAITCDGERTITYWDTVEGQSYYVYVHGRNVTDMGSFALTIEQDKLDPPNDYCGSAQEVPVPSTVYGTTFLASDDSTFTGTCDVTASAPGVWYTVVGNGRFISASLCSSVTSYDTQIYLFSGDSCQNLNCITFNEDGCGLQSEVSWKSEPEKVYWLLVGGFSSAVGEFEMTVI